MKAENKPQIAADCHIDALWTDTPITLPQFLASVERGIIAAELQARKGNRTATAPAIGITFRALRYRMDALALSNRTAPLRSPPDAQKHLRRFWPKLRMDAFRKYGNRCQCCGAGPEQGIVMEVDHVKPRHLFPALEFDLDNLQVLCTTCHQSKGALDQTDWRAGISR